MGLQRESFQRSALDKYKSHRRSFHLYRAAARLWAAGVQWGLAFEIMSEAFDAVIAE